MQILKPYCGLINVTYATKFQKCLFTLSKNHITALINNSYEKKSLLKRCKHQSNYIFLLT